MASGSRAAARSTSAASEVENVGGNTLSCVKTGDVGKSYGGSYKKQEYLANFPVGISKDTPISLFAPENSYIIANKKILCKL